MVDINAPHPHEKHKSQRANWLRAAILGVDDGIVSTSSIMVGVMAAQVDYKIILMTGIASLAAGAFSMAAGEYISVSSQRDAERADIEIEKRSLKNNPQAELDELAEIYVERGLDKGLAMQVAQQLHDTDAVTAHARDELGINSRMQANPLQAAAASALAFTLGSVIPIGAALLSSNHSAVLIVVISLAALAVSGALGTFIGGGNKLIGAIRVLLGGGIAMAVTALIGNIIGTTL